MHMSKCEEALFKYQDPQILLDLQKGITRMKIILQKRKEKEKLYIKSRNATFIVNCNR